MGRGGGCWGGVRQPEQSDLSFWLLVPDCSRWQLREPWWPRDGRLLERGQGPRGVRDPKHPFAQMGQSKQEDVKLVVAQAALIDIKASVFKNRSKIPLPSPAFAIPTIVPVAGLPPQRSSEPGASGQRGGAVQSRWLSECTVFLCKMELPSWGDYLLRAVLMGAVPWRAMACCSGCCGAAEPRGDLPGTGWLLPPVRGVMESEGCLFLPL